jgi:DtxR family transcriptional regulator, Mn-dependent transcriptional regulator
MAHVDDLTPIAQDYLKVIWSAIEWGDPPITTKGLAARFATTQANVSETMRRLQRLGLVDYQPYKPVTLTTLGESLAVAMVRRHRLLETYLAQALSYGWEEVHDEAERLEHAVSDEFLNRIDHLLGYPRIDPHGDPIPGPNGDWTPQTAAIKLSQAAPGQYRVVRVADTDPEQLSRLWRHHLAPGSIIQVPAALASVVLGDPSPASIEPGDLDAVHVRPA